MMLQRFKTWNRERLLKRYRAWLEKIREEPDYARWVERYDTVTGPVRASLQRRAQALSRKPLISVLMPVHNPEPAWLAAAIDSVVAQVYDAWELCIADDCSTDPRIRDVLTHYSRLDPRIRVAFRESNGHISAASNTALAMAKGTFSALLDHDDVLPPHALLCVAEAILKHPDVDLLYSDEDKIDAQGHRRDAYFKPDWNPELFRGHNMISHLGVYRTSLMRSVGGFREGLEGSQDYDLALRCLERTTPQRIVHIPHVLYHWRLHANSTAMGGDVKPYALDAGRRALEQHLARTGVAAVVVESRRGWYRVDYRLPDPAPRVAIFVSDMGDHPAYARCERALRAVTDYPRFDIVRMRATLGGRDMPARYNHAIADVTEDGDVIVFLDSHCIVDHSGWLQSLVAHALQPNVGCVGAKLCDERARIVGNALILGARGAFAAFADGADAETDGYCARARLSQNVCALDDGCVVVTRQCFDQVGGIVEGYRDIRSALVDLCMRLNRQGASNRWVPSVRITRMQPTGWRAALFESRRRAGRKRIAKIWNLHQFRDPAYNPNLGLYTTSETAFAHPPREPAFLP